MVVFLISFYQKLISPALKQLLGTQSMCRFTPSCSEYTKRSVKHYGVIKGLSLGFIRLMQCQPFSLSLRGADEGARLLDKGLKQSRGALI